MALRHCAFITAAVMLLPHAQADLPVHCQMEDVKGSWNFQMAPLTPYGSASKHVPAFPDRAGTDAFCTHRAPDNNDENLAAHESKSHDELAALISANAVLRVRLGSEQRKDSNGRLHLTASAESASGKWTMMYDEGFEVQMPTAAGGHRSFMAQSRYKCANSGGCKSSTVEDGFGHTPGYASLCSQTMVGWYAEHAADGRVMGYGCWVGQKTTPGLGEKVTSVVHRRDEYIQRRESVNMRSFLTSSLLQLEIQGGEASAAASLDMLESQLDRPTRGKKVTRVASHPTDVLLAEKKWNRYSKGKVHCKPDAEAMQIKGSLPKHFDWRDVAGVNETANEVVDQGSCGSCFAHATTTAMTQRINIALWKQGLLKKTGKQQVSMASVLGCSYTNQACSGGFPENVAWEMEHMGVPTEQCMKSGPPSEQSNGGSCNTECYKGGKQLWYSTSQRGYINGFLGKCSEAKIMKELHENGPVVIGIEFGASPEAHAEHILGYHAPTGTVLSAHNAEAANIVARGDSGTQGALSSWEFVNHAVVAVGWGETSQGVPYWVLRNSWGGVWNGDGHWKVPRGVDHLGVEASAVFVTPDFSRGAGKVLMDAHANQGRSFLQKSA